MAYARTYLLLQRAVELELGFCRTINKSLSAPFIQRFFAITSRLGDGIFWYSLIASLPVIYGWEALPISIAMIITGIANLIVYKLVKKLTCRERPCTTSDDIIPGAHLLDHYSFPSGHTLHAVAFTIIVVSFYPALAWLLTPFAVLVAMSRVILGLHYPTDVIAGAIIGASFASLAISLL